MGTVNIYLKQKMHMGLKAEAKARGFYDNQGRVSTSRMVQYALEYYYKHVPQDSAYNRAREEVMDWNDGSTWHTIRKKPSKSAKIDTKREEE